MTRTARAAPSLADNTPDYVTRSYDEELLEKYQPMLDLSEVDQTPTLKSYVARSAEHDTTALVYFATYVFQDGYTIADSHVGDHEPVVLEVDEDAEEIVTAYWDGWHWFVAESRAVTSSTDAEGMHPTLEVDAKHHYYRQTTVEGTELGTEEWSDAEIQGMLDNDWPIDIRTLTVPWSLSYKTDWWGDDVGNYSFEAMSKRIWLALGLRGSDNASEELKVT